MSHNLELRNGKYSLALTTGKNGLPWHNLGQYVENAMTWEEAMKLAQLDWSVSKQPLFLKNAKYDGNGGAKGWQVPDKFAVVRDDKEGIESILGYVGGVYTPLQNKYMFDFVDGLLEAEKGAHYESAGVLGKGEVIWCLARVPACDFSIGKDDKHETFLMFKSSHDGSISSTAMLTTVRVVCNNTLTSALSGADFSKNAIKVKHTKSAENKLNEVKKLWSGVRQNVETIKHKFDNLVQRKINKEGFSHVMGKLFGTDWQDSERKRNNALEIARIFDYNDDNRFPEQRGTAFALFNAVTNYVDHNRATRITDSNQQYTEVMARADSAFTGSGAAIKDKALDTICELASLSPAPVIVDSKNNTVNRIMDMMA